MNFFAFVAVSMFCDEFGCLFKNPVVDIINFFNFILILLTSILVTDCLVPTQDTVIDLSLKDQSYPFFLTEMS